MKAKYVALAASMFLYSTISVASDKMTYSEAVQNHKAAFGQFNGRPQSELQALWTTYVKTPESVVPDTNEKMKLVWSGSAKTVALPDGLGLYYVTVKYDGNAFGGGAWINVKSGTQIVGIPNPGDYQGYYWVKYEGGSFKNGDERWGKGFVFTAIYKNPEAQVEAQCSSGQTQTLPESCDSSRSWNWGCSFSGEKVSTCNADGFWGPYVVTRPASCVPANQYCP